MSRPLIPAEGPLHGYELAFLRAGGTLIRDHGNKILIMWLTRHPGDRI